MIGKEVWKTGSTAESRYGADDGAVTSITHLKPWRRTDDCTLQSKSKPIQLHRMSNVCVA